MGKTQTSLALIDSGNTINFDACIRHELTKDLKLKVLKKKIKIGSASQNHEMKVLGITNFQMCLSLNESKDVYFDMSALVILDLNDPINIGSYFLKKNMQLICSSQTLNLLNFTLRIKAQFSVLALCQIYYLLLFLIKILYNLHLSKA